MTATCSTCKHWDALGSHPIYQPQGVCERINSNSGDQAPASIWVFDASAQLNTRPTFGCTLHESRKETTI